MLKFPTEWHYLATGHPEELKLTLKSRFITLTLDKKLTNLNVICIKDIITSKRIWFIARKETSSQPFTEVAVGLIAP